MLGSAGVEIKIFNSIKNQLKTLKTGDGGRQLAGQAAHTSALPIRTKTAFLQPNTALKAPHPNEPQEISTTWL